MYSKVSTSKNRNYSISLIFFLYFLHYKLAKRLFKEDETQNSHVFKFCIGVTFYSL